MAVKGRPGVDFINICVRLFRSKKFDAFFGVWQLANSELKLSNSKRQLANGVQILPNLGCIFGKFSCRMLMKLNGEFFAKRRSPATFHSAKKVWWNRPQGLSAPSPSGRLCDESLTLLSYVINMNHISKAIENAEVKMSGSIEFDDVTLSSFFQDPVGAFVKPLTINHYLKCL